MFYSNFVRLCKINGKTPSAVAEELGFSRAASSGWADGSKPRKSTLIIIADYFGITVEELMSGVEDAKKAPTETSEREFVPSYEDWEKQAESWTDDQLMQAMRKLLDIQQRRRDDGR